MKHAQNIFGGKRGEKNGVENGTENGKTTVGQAANTDTLVASADAYLNALNKLIIKRKKTAPEPMDLSGSKYIREKDGTI